MKQYRAPARALVEREFNLGSARVEDDNRKKQYRAPARALVEREFNLGSARVEDDNQKKYPLAKRAQNYKRSFTREILDLTSKSSVISFAGGLPDTSLFPRDDIEKEIKALLQNQDNSLFQYSSANGVRELRIEIAKTYHNTKEDEILLTSGSQQALDIVCKTFLDNGDVVVTESPSYLAALSLFKMQGANIADVKLLQNGIDTEELERVFKKEKPKLLYIIPTFQNPTGISWDFENRKRVAKLAKEHGVFIVEDSPYSALRYEGEETDGFDKLLPNQTITIGTFSKTLAPDFRVGWIKAKRDLIEVFQMTKENSDLQSSKIFQLMIANLMRNGKLATHIERLKREYGSKRDTMAKALKKIFEKNIEFTTPKGGMFFWIKFHNDIDTKNLFDFCIKEGVAFVPSEPFFNRQNYSSCARLNFTNATHKEIVLGVERLKRGFNNYLRKK